MSKAATKRARQGQYSPPQRSKPTTGNLGPREPGPHGVVIDQRVNTIVDRMTRRGFIAPFNGAGVERPEGASDHWSPPAIDLDGRDI